MLHEMSAAGLLQKNKACLDALPRAYWYHEGCAAVAAALSRLLGQEQLSVGTALPGKPPLLIPRGCSSCLDLGLFLLSVLQTSWRTAGTSGEMVVSDAGAAERCFRDREIKETSAPAHKCCRSISSADGTGYTPIHLSEMLFFSENTWCNINF